MSAVCHFPSLEDAVMTAQQVIQYGVPIARIEMLNKDQMGISINYSKLKDIEAVPTLFFEFHGSETSNKENIKIVEELSKDNNGSSFKIIPHTRKYNECCVSLSLFRGCCHDRSTSYSVWCSNSKD